jgi:hypothetical protein
LRPRSIVFRIAELLPTTFWKATAGIRAVEIDGSAGALTDTRGLAWVSYMIFDDFIAAGIDRGFQTSEPVIWQGEVTDRPETD